VYNPPVGCALFFEASMPPRLCSERYASIRPGCGFSSWQ
jgi:hypothetical protein